MTLNNVTCIEYSSVPFTFSMYNVHNLFIATNIFFCVLQPLSLTISTQVGIMCVGTYLYGAVFATFPYMIKIGNSKTFGYKFDNA